MGMKNQTVFLVMNCVDKAISCHLQGRILHGVIIQKTRIQTGSLYEMWGSHSIVSEDSVLSGYDIVLLGEQSGMFHLHYDLQKCKKQLTQ
jgi:hypothetical protein